MHRAAAARSLGMPSRVLALKMKGVETIPSGAGHVAAEVWLSENKSHQKLHLYFRSKTVLS